jgi:cytochrome c oxidase assembly protein subunit 15
MAVSDRILNRASLGLGILTLCVMILGPLVRANDAGLACPDWPLCYGHVIPPYEFRVYLEFIHRAAVAVMGVLFLAWFVYIMVGFRNQFWKPATLAMALLISQILLGALTITEKLDPYIVKSHLINALLYWSCILFVWFRTGPGGSKEARSLKILSVVLLVLVFGQIYLGGRVSTNEAGLACTSFPACYKIQVFEESGASHWSSIYFPTMMGHVEKHMSHRFMAYALLVFLSVFYWMAGKKMQSRSRSSLRLVLLLTILQSTLGALNVLFQIPVPVTVAHSAIAIVLYGAALIHVLEVTGARQHD